MRRAFPEEGDFGGYDTHEYGRFWWIAYWGLPIFLSDEVRLTPINKG